MSSTDPIASVVIAAHNEQAVIGRCLAKLTITARPGELDVIVVANGCTDRTAEIAEAAGARVVITTRPGKPRAITLGDTLCRTFPRIYLDADVEIDTRSIRALVVASTQDGVLAASPVAHYDISSAGPAAKRFHRVFEELIGNRRVLAGAGAYLLTEAGHKRAFPLPDVLSDDGWVQRSFAGGERVRVPGARSIVRPARTVSAVVRRRARVRTGNRELDRLGRPSDEQPLRAGQLRELIRAGRISRTDAACFVAVLVGERALTRWRDLRGRSASWFTDSTSRTR